VNVCSCTPPQADSAEGVVDHAGVVDGQTATHADVEIADALGAFLWIDDECSVFLVIAHWAFRSQPSKKCTATQLSYRSFLLLLCREGLSGRAQAEMKAPADISVATRDVSYLAAFHASQIIFE